MKKSALSKSLPWILIAGGAAALYFYLRPKPTNNLMPPPPDGGAGVLPPAGQAPAPSPAPAPIKPLMIGQSAKVKSGTTALGYITKYKGSMYPSGGNKGGLGGLNADTYAGTVKEIDSIYKSVRVENYQYPMKDSAGHNIYSYWLDFNSIIGNY